MDVQSSLPSLDHDKQHEGVSFNPLAADAAQMSAALPPEDGENLLQMQAAANRSPQVQQQKAYQAMADQSSQKGGLPIQLKAGMEGLSGFDLGDVRVHYNSSKPAQLQAEAYAEGSNIYLGPGREQHLGHELGHVVQQKRGAVRPTHFVNGAGVNDDPQLENEADSLAAQALSYRPPADNETQQLKKASGQGPAQTWVSPPSRKTRYKRINKSIKWFRDLSEEAQQKVLLLHSKNKMYQKDEAIALATGDNQAFLDEIGNSGSSDNPFDRYAKDGPGYMDQPEEYGFGVHFGTLNQGNEGGFGNERYGQMDFDPESLTPQTSVAYGISGSDLTPRGTKRNKDQSYVMGNLSPNLAARELGLSSSDEELSWEWLHLVAFSIGETHVSSYSDRAEFMIANYEQEQQIPENMVLGTYAANTAMITFEESIKDILRSDPDLRLVLSAMASVQSCSIQPKRKRYDFTVATNIRYDFQFYYEGQGDCRVSEPMMINFDTLSKDDPLEGNIGDFKKRVFASLQNMQSVKNQIQGPYVQNFTQVGDFSGGMHNLPPVEMDIEANERMDDEWFDNEELISPEDHMLQVNYANYMDQQDDYSIPYQQWYDNYRED